MSKLGQNPLGYAVVIAAAVAVGLLLGRALSGGSLRPDVPMLVTIGLAGVGAFVFAVVRNRRSEPSSGASSDS